jgi:tetratricopeptide (TPR) repeat protein
MGTMRISPRVWAACFAVSAVSLLAPSPARNAHAVPADVLPAAALADWREVRTPNFVITSQQSSRTTRLLAEHAEALRSAMEQLTRFDVTVSRPVLVTVFRDRKAMEPYLHRVDGQPAAASGTYRRYGEADVITVDGGAPNSRHVLAHEYAHLFLERNHPRLPLWLEEGLAEFYGTFTVARGRARLGGSIDGHIRRLREGPWLPMSRLVTLTHDDPLYNEADRKTVVYAQVWAVAHYLVVGEPERAGQLAAFIRLVDGGAEHDHAFLQAFGTDPDGLLHEVRAAMNRPVLRGFAAAYDPPEGARPTVETLVPADHLTRLGELLLADPSRPPLLAERHFERALRHDPAWARALSGLGEVALRLRRPELALDRQRRAAALDPNDPVIAYRLGTRLGSARPGSRDAIAALRTATRLDPSFAPAWTSLATQLRAADAPQQALAAASRAATLEPLNPRVVLDLVQALLDSRRRSDAVSLIDTPALRAVDDRDRAWALVARDDLKSIRTAVADGDFEDAEDRIASFETEVLPRIDDESFGVQLNVLRSQISDRRFAQRLAAAADARLAGDHEAAETIAHELAGDPAAGPWADRARRFLADTRAPSPDPVPVATVSEGELDNLNRLLATRDYRAALRLLEELEQRVSHDRDDWIDAKIREIEGTLARNAFVDTYNRAVDLYNAGSIQAACQVMRTVDTSSLSSTDRRDVIDFLSDCP